MNRTNSFKKDYLMLLVKIVSKHSFSILLVTKIGHFTQPYVLQQQERKITFTLLHSLKYNATDPLACPDPFTNIPEAGTPSTL